MMYELNPRNDHELSTRIQKSMTAFYRAIKGMRKVSTSQEDKLIILQEIEKKFKLRKNTLKRIYLD